jgi:hypothetical protein
MISGAEKQINASHMEVMQEEDEHEDELMNGLFTKYKGVRSS